EFVRRIASGHGNRRWSGITIESLNRKDNATPDPPVFPHLFKLRTVLIGRPNADVVRQRSHAFPRMLLDEIRRSRILPGRQSKVRVLKHEASRTKIRWRKGFHSQSVPIQFSTT